MSIFLGICLGLFVLAYFAQLFHFLVALDCNKVRTKKEFWLHIIPFAYPLISFYKWYGSLQ